MSNQRNWMRASVLALALWAVAATEAWAQISVVVPNANVSTAGNTDNRFPFLVTGGQRYQEVFAASQFGAFGGPQLISQMTMRNGILVSTPFTSFIGNIQISLSTIAAGPDALSSGFASNIGGNNTVVYNGTLTLSSTNGPGPWQHPCL